MTTIQDAYINALLADATYALSVTGSYRDDDLKLALNTRMTPTLANFIGDNFSAATHIDSSDNPLLGTGFDATIWRGNSGTEFAGKTYVSFTGSEALADFVVADLNLTLAGAAVNQIVDMVNWWLKNTTATNQQAQQITWNGAIFANTATVTGTGIITEKSNITVDGHSLGGHLATAFTRLFGGQAGWSIDHTYTYNSAGFTFNSESIFKQIETLLGPGISKGYFDGLVGQTNYFAEHGISATTRTFLNGQQGLRVPVFNESGLNPLNNHYMYKLTDALALGDAMAKLDPTFDIAKLNELLERGANQSNASLESILDGLRKTILGGTIVPTPIGDVGESAASRQAFYQNLTTLTANSTYQELIGKVQIVASPIDPATAADIARSDFGAFLSLVNLTPFELKPTTNDAIATLKNANVALGAQWDADNALTPTQRGQYLGNYSDLWLADRASMLGWKQAINKSDASLVNGTYRQGWGWEQPLYFEDFASEPNQILRVRGTFQPERYLFGSSAGDVLMGGIQSDHLYGMDGNDTLSGGAGSDYLFGGSGYDTYTFGKSDGNDYIYDSDGSGEIVIQGTTLGQVLRYGSEYWLSNDGKIRGKIVGATLLIQYTGGSITVGNWHDGDFGITLSTDYVTPPFAPASPIHGNDIDDHGTNVFVGTNENDVIGVYIHGVVYGNDGNDWITLNRGDTQVYAGSGDDVVTKTSIHPEGDNGSLVYGEDGNDKLLVNGLAGNTIYGGNGDDEIRDGDGSSLLAGDIGNDTIYGGKGNDQLEGGDGDDELYSYRYFGVNNNLVNGQQVDWDWSQNGNDFLDGGEGNDRLHGGDGDDYLYGRNGDDWLDGGDGANYLDGGSGNDELYGAFGTLVGGDGDDLLVGWDGAIDGGEGNDFLAFGSYMEGGNGDDTYQIDFGALGIALWGDGEGIVSQISESSGGGSDTVISDWSYTLENNLENLYLSNAYLYLLDNGVASDYEYFSHATITAAGNELDNVIVGNAAINAIYGYGGNDVLEGGEGNDQIYGGAGDDELIGGEGDDTYYFNLGDGHDRITEVGGNDKIVFGAGITASQIALSGADNGVTLTVSGGDSIHVSGNRVAVQFASSGDDTFGLGFGVSLINANDLPTGSVNVTGHLEQNQTLSVTHTLTDADGMGNVSYQWQSSVDGVFWDSVTGATSNTFTLTEAQVDKQIRAVATYVDGHGTSEAVASDATEFIANVNDAPTGSVNISGSAALGQTLTIDNVLTDLDGLGAITYQWQSSADGMVWENIPEAMALSFTLTETEVGRQVRVVASYTDGHNTLESATSRATEIVVEEEAANRAPTLAIPLIDQSVQEDSLFSYTIPANAFTDVDSGDVLTYTATLANGDPLPGWLGFDAAKRTFSGTPANGDVGSLSFKVTATDIKGLSVSDVFDLSVANTNDVPTVANAISSQLGAEDDAFSFVVPANTFADMDAGDALTLSATLVNGDPLPSWLIFDAASRTLSGTPLNGDVGSLNLKVTATDIAGASVSSTFMLNIANSNDAPIVANSIGDQIAVDASAFSYTAPANTFADVDAGDSLVFSAALADGNPLPGWLNFNAVTGTFIGTPSSADIGSTFNIKVTATDSAGASTNTQFSLNVLAMPDQNLVGTAANDILIGGSGNDTLDGLAGADTLRGGLGNDTYVVDNIGDVVTESANQGTDTIQSNISITNMVANVENLTLIGAAAINGVGNVLNNVITGNNANNTLNGGAGADTLIGGLGNDTYVVDDFGDVVTENLAEGTDTVQSAISYTLGANLENLTLTGAVAISGTGNDLNNSMTGNSAANMLTGGLGNDVLNGGAGADTLVGGLGNDTYVVDNIGDVVTENVAEGTDIVQASVSYSLAAEVENLTLTGAAAINGTGNDLNNIITGNTAANILGGGGGNDTLNGGAGADTLMGGLGDDIYIVDNAGDVIAENLGEGIDLVQSAVSITLSDNVENLTLTGALANSATGNALDNVLTGNAAANILTGDAGNDTLNGAAGADVMLGGIGNDTYVVDNVGDVVTENSDEGMDTVRSSITVAALAANVENLILTGTSSINGTGNDLNNALTGNTGNNTLNGGLGADSMAGGLGNDVYYVDDAGDLVAENANEGTDTVNSNISYTLTANVEKLTLTGADNINASGNVLNNTLTGNAAQNILDGGFGNDTMAGGLGDDTYIVDSIGDIVTEAASAGADQVFSSVSYTLGSNIENLTLTGTDTINATGNTLANVLTGNIADNTLNGGTGADTMVGGLGNDIYVVDNVGDVVTESADEGIDTVKSSITVAALAANVENLVLTGTSSINGAGNGLNNTLTGNSGNNTLNGSLGADSMAGGLGNDVYYVDDAGDLVVENASEGTDTVNSNISYTLTANVEKLTLTSADNTNATGNDLNNTLTGNAARNILNGGLGNDTMSGGLGDDTYIVDSTGDIITEAASAGTDQVFSSVSHTLASNVENLMLTGTDAINATGNTLANILTGNIADNILNGGTGADTMVGGLGNDIYVVDNAGDVVTEAAGEGTDLVQSGVTHMLAANVENLTLTGTAAINGTGNTLENMLSGNTGNNVLNGAVGNDLLQGMAGNDTLTDTSGGNLLDGGAGNDTLTGGVANDILLGGIGNDTLNTGNGADLLLFNSGHGQDTVNASTGADDTLSLGGGILYNNLSLSKTGNDLILKTGGTDQITLKNWYASVSNHSVVNLQVIAESMSDFSLGGGDPLRNNKVENFDFAAIVADFDASGAPSNWALTDARLTAHLGAGSDTAAIGGDLAYQYGKTGTLAGIGVNATQSVISQAQISQTAKAMNDPSIWQAELVKLG